MTRRIHGAGAALSLALALLSAGREAAAQTDPLLEQQWHLKPRAEEPAGANVEAAWPTTRGSGIVIGIVDDGLQHSHPDLQPNYVGSLSYDFNGDDPDPSPNTSSNCSLFANCHGTAVAGVAAARGENGIGVSGAAPLASLAGLRLIAAPASDAEEAAALGHEADGIHIASNSWGPSDNGATLDGPGPLAGAAIESAATSGRGGKGRVFTWAAGNGLASQDNCNFDGYANDRFVIAVAALDDTGQQAPYSEPCSAMFVTAPSSGGSRGITTTDLQGSKGYSPGDYTSSFGGTSSATPLVSGVVALVLAENPDLTWRDVKHILVQSSHQINPGDANWSSGPHPHSEKFGFGLVDGEAAVDLAATWTNVAPESSLCAGTALPNVAIPDNQPAGVTDSITIPVELADFTVEHVEVEFDATHPFRGDLEVTLTSPAGVVSRLATVRPADSGDNFSAWRFGSVRHWGESPAGTWTLRVADRAAPDEGTWNSWTLRIYGTPGGSDTTAPSTTITEGPPAEIAVSSAAFTWTGSDNLTPVDYLRYAVRLHPVETEFSPVDCATGRTYTGLANGDYTFYVKARDQAGNEDATPDSVTFTVDDSTPPETTITGSPSGTITVSSASFTWTGSDAGTPAGSLVYAFRLDPLEPGFSAFGSATSRSYSSLPNGTYTFYVKARDLGGNEDPSPASQTFTVSVSSPSPSPSPSKPAAPSNLTATVTSASAIQVKLTWKDNSTNETKFKVRRKTGADGTWGLLGALGTNATSFADTAVMPRTTYFYKVVACNSAGCSSPSNVVSVGPPPAPSNLTAVAVSGAQVNLAWQDNAGDETHFKVRRKTGADGTFTRIATLGANATSFADTTASPGTTYFYKVAACNALGCSPSNVVSVATP